MNTTRAVVQSVTGRTVNTPRGRTPTGVIYDIVCSDGRTYNTWTASLANAAKALENQEADIEFEIDQRGEHTNFKLKGIIAAGMGIPVAQPQQSLIQNAPPVSTIEVNDNGGAAVSGRAKDEQIARGTAGKIVAMSLSSIPAEMQTPEHLLDLADFWVNYILRGRETPYFTPSDVAAAGVAANSAPTDDDDIPF